MSDAGFFGPDSVSWQVNRETSVLFGGARALLMHATHPLVIAGARQTGFYQRDAWKRLERTLQLQYTITFGARVVGPDAREVAALIAHPPRGVPWRPVLRFVARWAFGALPDDLREAYGVRWNPLRELNHRGSLATLKLLRPALPPRIREIMP